MTGLRTAKLSRLLSVTTSAVDRMVLTVQVRFLAVILPHVGTNPCRALGVEGVPVIDFGPHLTHRKRPAGGSGIVADSDAHDVSVRVFCGDTDDSVGGHKITSVRPQPMLGLSGTLVLRKVARPARWGAPGEANDLAS